MVEYIGTCVQKGLEFSERSPEFVNLRSGWKCCNEAEFCNEGIEPHENSEG